MAKVAVVGVGAIGAALAAGLVSQGHAVVLCTRRPLAAFAVETPAGTVQVDGLNLTDAAAVPAGVGPVDWIVVATKTYDAAGAAAWFGPLSGSGTGPVTRIAIVQNGVEHVERFAPYLDAGFDLGRLLPVVINTPAERRPDGSVLQRMALEMIVPAGDGGEGFAGLFGAGAVRLTEDFLTAAWRKLCLNSAGVLNTLTGRPNGLFQDDAWAAIAEDVVGECAAVGRAAGARLSADVAAEVVAWYRAAAPEGVNSMLGDLRAGRPMELDARNGVIVRVGERVGVKTPLNRMAVGLMLGR